MCILIISLKSFEPTTFVLINHELYNCLFLQVFKDTPALINIDHLDNVDPLDNLKNSDKLSVAQSL